MFKLILALLIATVVVITFNLFGAQDVARDLISSGHEGIDYLSEKGDQIHEVIDSAKETYDVIQSQKQGQ